MPRNLRSSSPSAASHSRHNTTRNGWPEVRRYDVHEGILGRALSLGFNFNLSVRSLVVWAAVQCVLRITHELRSNCIANGFRKSEMFASGRFQPPASHSNRLRRESHATNDNEIQFSCKFTRVRAHEFPFKFNLRVNNSYFCIYMHVLWRCWRRWQLQWNFPIVFVIGPKSAEPHTHRNTHIRSARMRWKVKLRSFSHRLASNVLHLQARRRISSPPLILRSNIPCISLEFNYRIFEKGCDDSFNFIVISPAQRCHFRLGISIRRHHHRDWRSRLVKWLRYTTKTF